MKLDPTHSGREELLAARRESRSQFWAVFLFSVLVNLLMLTGPLYMLQIYDRVLGSRSEETLIALSLLVAFLYGMMGLLDYARGRVLARVGARFQDNLDRRVFSALLRKKPSNTSQKETRSGLRDLEAVQRLLGSPALLALFDTPWTPLFLAAIFIFHTWLGYLAVGGGVILIGFALLNQKITRKPQQELLVSGAQAEAFSSEIMGETEVIQGLGMRNASFERWKAARTTSLKSSIRQSDRGGAISATTKTLRLFLQSAMLGLGAYLVLQNQLTAGAMIAASILLGRALAPVEQSIAQWTIIQRAHLGWQSLQELLSEVPQEAPPTPLPRPEGRLVAEQVTTVPPGATRASLRLVSFELEPGQALGVIGPSGSGKTTLAKTLTGAWAPAGGKIRLGGAALDQYDGDTLGQLIGYIPQHVSLFEGTLAENIARLDPNADPKKVIEAAQRAAAHELILRQPQGYDTPVSKTKGQFSGGELQRIGLARALYGDPVLLVLDEPNSNLDAIGTNALNAAIRDVKARGGTVIIMAHRPAGIQECETLLVLEHGARKAFGPRDEVLRETVKNHAQIVRADQRTEL